MKGGDDVDEAMITAAALGFGDEARTEADADMLGTIGKAQDDEIAEPRFRPPFGSCCSSSTKKLTSDLCPRRRSARCAPASVR
jgi:hypothetical protein